MQITLNLNKKKSGAHLGVSEMERLRKSQMKPNS